MDPDDGCEWTKVEYPIWGIAREGTAYDPFDWSEVPPDSIYSRDLDRKVYELTDHLGNARVVLKDWKQSTGTVGVRPYEGVIGQYSNIYPFGMEQPGRSWSGGAPYRYGYNGMETSPETGGENYTTYFRQYDARLARWMSTDPVVHEWESPYAAMGNNPILASDASGADSTTGTDAPPTAEELEQLRQEDRARERELERRGEREGPEEPFPDRLRDLRSRRMIPGGAVSSEEIAEEPVVSEIMTEAGVSKWELVTTIVLDFIPVVGTGKGIVEAITGEDLVTGDELTTFERSTGWFPIAGKVGRGIKNIGKLSRAGSKLRRGTKILREYRPVIGVVTEGSEHLDDAARAADKATDVTTGANKVVQQIKWPWKKSATIEEIRKGNCLEWAKKIQAKNGGELMKITPAHARFIGPVNTKSGDFIGADFYDHYAVRIGDMVYDRITGPEGMLFDDYKNLFEYNDELIFELIK